jgi:hypothetical protein
MKVEIGGYDLVYSETIIQFENHPIIITLRDEIEGDFIFHIYFVTNRLNPVMAVNTTSIDMFNLRIDFINFDNANNVGSTQILHFGTLRRRNLYFNYRVFDIVNCGKTLIVNFYTQK